MNTIEYGTARAIIILVILNLPLVAGCGGGSGSDSLSSTAPIPPVAPVPPVDETPPVIENPPSEIDPTTSWEIQTRLLAGNAPTDCGALYGRDVALAPLNGCIKDNFLMYAPFFGSYTRGGTDSLLSSGVAYDGTSLFLIYFDSYNISDGTYGYEILECLEPRYTDQNRRFPPFLCDEYIETDPITE